MIKKIFHYFVTLTTIIWSMGLPLFGPQISQAATATTVALTDMASSGFMRLSQGGNFYAPVFQITIGSNENTKTLAAVTVAFAAANSTTPTWTQGAATSSELLDLATTNGGVTLWKESNSTPSLQFDGTPDTQVTLATNPVYAASNAFTLTPGGACGATCTLAENQIFYVALRPDSSGVTNGNAFTVTFPANGLATTASSPTVTAVTTPSPIVMENEAAGIRANGVSGAAGASIINVRFTKPVQKVGGGALSAADTPFIYVDGGGTAQTVSSITHTPCQDFATLTMSGNLDAEDVDSTPATVAAGSNKIASCGSGEVLGTTAVGMSNPLNITTSTIPTATVATVYNNSSPLVSFAASGGTGPYTFAANSAADTTILTNAGLAIVNDGGTYKLTGTVVNIPGNYGLNIKVTDSSGPAQIFTKFFNLNIATAGGVVPYITQITPPGGAQGASGLAITITGSNTSLTTSSTVEFLLSGVNDTNLTVSSKTSTSGTNLGFSLAIAGAAATGTRDVRITSGSQTVTMPNGFSIFVASGSGLNLLLPTDSATSVLLPSSFSFNPSSNGTINSYRITVRPSSDVSSTALWDYIFSKPVDSQNSNGSHCSSTSCNVTYGAGQFRNIAPSTPTPLSPNTTYYWQVKTYTETPFAFVANTSTAVESASVRSFSTTASVTDGSPPGIMHRPLFQATASANLVIFARVMDNIATKDTTPALATTLKYCNTGSSCDPATVVTGSYVGAGYYKYTITSGNVPAATGYIRYYLEATDGTNTSNFKQTGNTPFTITTIAAGATTIAGTVKDSTNTCVAGVQTAAIFADGTGFNTTTNSSCAFTLSSLPAGTYDLVAIKEGYGDRRYDSVATGSAATAFNLSSGFSGGFGGDTTKPMVKFTGPPDNSMAPPSDSSFKVFVGFSKAMSQTAVTTTGNMTVNEVNISTGQLTDITATKGSWTYYATAPNTAGVPPEANMAVWTFSGVNTFGENKTMAVKISANVSDTAGNSIQGNQSDGAYVYSFNTGAAYSGGGGGSYGSGSFAAPFVVGTTPKPGTPSVALNTKLAVTFSQPMDLTTLTTSSVKLYSVVSGTETLVTTGTYGLDTSKTVLTFVPSSALTASTQYRIKVLGSAASATGVTLAPPASVSQVMFQADFNSGTTTDSGAPTKLGSAPTGGATGVPVNTGSIMVAFSKPLDPSTVNTTTVSLAIGSTTVNGTVSYDDSKNAVFFMPKVALSSSTTYTLTLSTAIKGLNGVNLVTAQTVTFTTGSADTVVPGVALANADDYRLALTFSEPMQAAKATDTTNFTTSVLNPANYTLKQGITGFDASSGGTAVSLSAATLEYDNMNNTVIIKGITLSTAATNGFYILVASVKDLSGNAIGASNSLRGPVQSSSSTGGVLGPGTAATGSFSGPTGPNYTSAGIGYIPPAGVRPFNTNTGVTSIYGIELPIAKQIPATTGKIVLTFPIGFDVSGAMKDVNSPPNRDINGPGLGTVVFGSAAESPQSGGANNDGVIVDAIARTVTITLGAVATRSENSDTHDFLRLDIAGIVNSTVPMDFGTAGYTVDIKTYSGTTLLDASVSQPFFVSAGGTRTVTVTLTSASAITASAKVFLGSPMTGMQDKTITFSNATSGTTTFTSLSDGDYQLFTDPIITDTAPNPDEDWLGQPMPTPLRLTGDLTKTIALTKQSGSANNVAVTIKVKGPANELLDVFAGGQSGFSKKKATLDGTATNYDTITMSLVKGQKWFIGVGPQMPDNAMSGPPPAPSYMPPRPIEVTINADGSFKEDSVDALAADAANDGTISFILATAGLTIAGTVQDGSGNAVANAEVYAYTPQGGFGTHTQASAQGAFTLGVVTGSYKVGAFVPGMPSGQEMAVNITSGGQVYVNGATAATTNVIIKISKPDYKISGKVSDGSTVFNGASVYAYKTDGPGNAQAMTDNSGAYTLYVGSGTWKVGAFVPGYGQLPETTLTVSGSDLTNQNLSPTTSNFGTITGTVFRSADATIDAGEGLADVFVHVERGSGTANFSANDTATGTDGTFTLKVPAGSGYTIRAFKPGQGQIAPLDENLAAITAFTVSAGGTVIKNIRSTALNTITFTFSATVTEAFVDLFNTSTNMGNHAEVRNGTSATMQLPNGTYKVKAFIPGVDGTALALSSTTPGQTVLSGSTIDSNVTIDGVEGITVTLPTIRTISGTVYKTAATGGNELDKAWVELMNATTGIRFGALTATDGTFSLKAANGTYKLQAMKPGYIGTPLNLTVAADSASNNIVLNAASFSVSGQVKIGSTGASRAFVRAEKVGDVGFAGIQADATGNYTIYLSTGSWRVYGVAEGYEEVEYTTASNVIAGATTNANITLSTPVTLKPPKSKPITPAQGGELIDSDAGVKLTVPASAFGTSTAAGQVQAKETNNVSKTASAKIAGNKGKEITATDSSGNPINSLSGDVTLEMTYTDADLTAAGIASGDESKLNLAYWDDTANNWVTTAATIDTTTNTIRGTTNHLTVFAIVLPFVATPAQAASSSGGSSYSSPAPAAVAATPAAPTYSVKITGLLTETSSRTVNLTLSATPAVQMMISNNADFSGAAWETYVTSKTWELTSGDGLKTIYAKFKDSIGTVSNTASTTINLKTPAVTNLPVAEVTPPATADSRAQQIEKIVNEAGTVKSLVAEDLAKAVGKSRDTGLEQRYESTIVARVVLANTPAADKAQVLNFVTYGTPTTTVLGAGERAGVVNSFKTAFGKVPTSDSDWADVIKIANGRFPGTLNPIQEKAVEATFKKIYLRLPNRSQANDNAAITVMAYGLRTATRNLNSEKAAIKSFKAIFGKSPTSAADWDAVRATAYSGAKR
ncbi:MAG: carboxypeptidase regulatory-like domain-containing protein [Candidatus Kerfeldbacteria bacterium]|nr:carboxypeptidase regulatory-like domain-containing protein [Candidatus Kerfeldbacteria bacterium]